MTWAMDMPDPRGYEVKNLMGYHFRFCNIYDAPISELNNQYHYVTDSFYGQYFLLDLIKFSTTYFDIRDLYRYAKPHDYFMHKKPDWTLIKEIARMMEYNELLVLVLRDPMEDDLPSHIYENQPMAGSSSKSGAGAGTQVAKPAARRSQSSAETSAASSAASASTHETNNTSTTEPTVTTITETFGSNEAVWTVDEKGRPISVEAKLDSTYNEARSTGEKKLQASVGGEARLDDDDGGHLIGHRFMSDQGVKNLFPQNANLNRGAYKKMENEWADWTAEGFEVKLMVELDPPGAERPKEVYAEYKVIDPKNGELVFKREHEFSNASGESFTRFSRKDMKEMRG